MRSGGATGVVASALGVMAGVSGLDHGFFEVLQGNSATTGLFVHSIGPRQQMWAYGTEDALTLVPNFLVTGILAVAVAIAVIVWSIGFIDRRHGSRVFLGLGSMLLLVGGGVAMVVSVILGWAIARRIGRPIEWWRRLTPEPLARGLERVWPGLLVVAGALYAVALETAIVGFVPDVSNPDVVQGVCWSTLVAMLGIVLLALVGASARDLPVAASGEARAR